MGLIESLRRSITLGNSSRQQHALAAGGSLRLDLDKLDDTAFVELGYQAILRRKADEGGKASFVKSLGNHTLDRNGFLDILLASEEFALSFKNNAMGPSIHSSRITFLRQLPKADVIVDIGGSSQGSDAGAMVEMGYPYPFKKLTIIDLPFEMRHELYQNGRPIKTVETRLGSVDYLYQSMTTLVPIADQSVDLVYSGQSIEHITQDDAQRTYKEILRVLKPGGYFALDTPNGRLTRLQQDAFIDPDHKIEYTHGELSSALVAAGFEIRLAKGLNYAGKITTREQFSTQQVARNFGMFDAIEDCYILAYVCQKPLDS